MKGDEPSRDPLRVLRSSPVPLAAEEEVAQERARLVPWLEEQIASLPQEVKARTRAQRRRALLWGSLGLSAAASVAFVWTLGSAARDPERTPEERMAQVGTQSEQPPAAATLSSGRLQAGMAELLVGSRLAALSAVETSQDEPATLLGALGYEATLAPNSRVTLGPESHATELRLERGRIALAVPKLKAGSALSVVTRDARVTVRGTRFSVELPGQETDKTCVRVEEGSVEVARAEGAVRLGAGQESGCPVLSSTSDAAVSQRATRTAAQAKAPPSTLAIETVLLTRGLRLERAGDVSGARSAFRELIAQHPRSPLVSDALAALNRLDKKE